MLPGYIFLKPLDRQKRCQWLEGYITSDMFAGNKPYYEAECGRKLKSAGEANEAYQEKFK